MMRLPAFVRETTPATNERKISNSTAGERSVEGLWHLIGKLLDAFSPKECANYFAAAGYDPD
jgi:hypothetical protein